MTRPDSIRTFWYPLQLLVLCVGVLSLLAPNAAAWVSLPGPAAPSGGIGTNSTPTWVNLTSSVMGGKNPGARNDGAMVWVPGTRHALLFGGLLNNPYANAVADTWAFNGTGWVDRTHANWPHPSARWGLQYEMTYDAADGYVLLFGGEVGYIGTGNNHTWAHFNGSWHQLTRTAGQAPSPRFAPDLVYDPADGHVVMFGGTPYWGASTCYNDTWIFSGGKWTNLSTSVAPSPRRAADMVYDPALKSIVLVGGSTASFTALHDTWLFRGGHWTQVHTNLHPGAQWWGAMAYDPVYRSVLLFGGCTAAGCVSAHGGTWFFTANKTWVNATSAYGLTAEPSARSGAMTVYDPVAREVVVYGGSFASGYNTNEVWAFR